MSLRPNKRRRISASPPLEDLTQDGNAAEDEVDDAAAMHDEIWDKLLEGVEDLQETIEQPETAQVETQQVQDPPDSIQEVIEGNAPGEEPDGLDLDAFLKQSLAQAESESDAAASVSPAPPSTALQLDSVLPPAPEIFVSQPAAAPAPARTSSKSQAKLPLSPSPVSTALSPGLSPTMPPSTTPFASLPSPLTLPTTSDTPLPDLPRSESAIEPPASVAGLQHLLDSFSNQTAELVKASLSPPPPTAPAKPEPDIARAALQAAHLLTYFKHLLDHQITIAKRNGDAFNEEHAAHIVVETLRRAQLDNESREALLIVFNQICQGAANFTICCEVADKKQFCIAHEIAARLQAEAKAKAARARAQAQAEMGARTEGSAA